MLSTFLDTLVSLAPTHIRKSFRRYVGWSCFWISVAAEHFCATVMWMCVCIFWKCIFWECIFREWLFLKWLFRKWLKYLNFADFYNTQLCVELTQPMANWIFVVLCFDGEIVQRQEEAQGENLIKKYLYKHIKFCRTRQTHCYKKFPLQ